MKRYLVWCGEFDCPYTAEEDFVGDFDSLDEVRADGIVDGTIARQSGGEITDQSRDWVRVLDTETGEWVMPVGPIYGEDGDG